MEQEAADSSETTPEAQRIWWRVSSGGVFGARSCRSQTQSSKIVDAMLPDPVNAFRGLVPQVVATEVAVEEQHVPYAVTVAWS